MPATANAAVAVLVVCCGSRLVFHRGNLDGFVSSLFRYVEPSLTVVVLHNARPTDLPLNKVASQLGGLFSQGVLPSRSALRVDPSVAPASYDAYVGHYRLDRGLVQRVTREDGRLYSQLTGQSRYEVFPSGPDRFFFKVVDAQLTFQRDGSGAVTSARHDQNAAVVVAQRIDDQEGRAFEMTQPD